MMTIENLPNELLSDVFQYLDGFELHSTWFELNQRLRNVVCSVMMHVAIDEFDDVEIYQSFFVEHAKQFVYIRFKNYTRIFTQLDLSMFSNIRSLYLNLITNEQYDQIIPNNFPLLSNLKIKPIDASRNPALLLFGSKQFPRLTSCHLSYFYLTNEPLQACSTVRSLCLDFCSAEIFFSQIKIYLPNLISFKTISGTDITFIHSANKQENLFHPHRNLRSIKIDLGKDTTFDYLPLIISVLPELCSLELYCRTYCDYPQVAELLRTKLVNLKYFDFVVNESRFQRLPNVEILHKLSPWFSQVKIEETNSFNRIICKTKKTELNEYVSYFP